MLKVDDPFKTGGIIVSCHSKEESLQFLDEVLCRFDVENLEAWEDRESNNALFENQFRQTSSVVYMLMYVEHGKIWIGWETDRDWLEEEDPYRSCVFLEFSEAFGPNVELGDLEEAFADINLLFGGDETRV